MKAANAPACRHIRCQEVLWELKVLRTTRMSVLVLLKAMVP